MTIAVKRCVHIFSCTTFYKFYLFFNILAHIFISVFGYFYRKYLIYYLINYALEISARIVTMNTSKLEYIGNDASPSDELKFVKKKKKRKKMKRKLSDSVNSCNNTENSIESSDDDKPLALCRRIKQGNKQYLNKSKNKTVYIPKSSIRNKSNKKLAKSNKKVYQYKNGKKVFCQSGMYIFAFYNSIFWMYTLDWI